LQNVFHFLNYLIFMIMHRKSTLSIISAVFLIPHFQVLFLQTHAINLLAPHAQPEYVLRDLEKPLNDPSLNPMGLHHVVSFTTITTFLKIDYLKDIIEQNLKCLLKGTVKLLVAPDLSNLSFHGDLMGTSLYA